MKKIKVSEVKKLRFTDIGKDFCLLDHSKIKSFNIKSWILKGDRSNYTYYIKYQTYQTIGGNWETINEEPKGGFMILPARAKPLKMFKYLKEAKQELIEFLNKTLINPVGELK